MNNEDKIMNVLEQVVEQLDKMDSRMDTMQKQLDAVHETTTRVAITQENVVLPRLQLLAEGHTTMMDMMARKSRVEALEENMAILKSAVEAHAVAVAIAELNAAK